MGPGTPVPPKGEEHVFWSQTDDTSLPHLRGQVDPVLYVWAQRVPFSRLYVPFTGFQLPYSVF